LPSQGASERQRLVSGNCLIIAAGAAALWYAWPEYQPARFHCKYLLVDDCWASVGSANLDNRSLSLNEEANLNVLDKKFVVAHTRVFEEDKSHSREITLDDWQRRPWGEKIRGRIDRCSPRRCSAEAMLKRR
jgi:phosphatidylserine/phosphatidylglycerophosphate/cardiolipin synthase-like enzyme